MGFNKKYEIVVSEAKSVDWDEYVSNIQKEYKRIISENKDEEKVFQKFFEENPCMLPGAYGFFGESGHTPYLNVLITQPILTGLTTRIPDFLWIANDSCNVYPVFIEIEKPAKKWFRGDGNPSADFTHAQNQLTDWKVWFGNPTHQKLFFEYYDVDSEFLKGKTIKPYYVLIYGSRDEFKKRHDLNLKRGNMQRENEVYMTFDRLSPNIKGRNLITCYVKDQIYYSKYVQPVFRLGPAFADDFAKIHNIEDTIEINSRISDDRKQFLISRVPYWQEFGRLDSRGIIYTGDWE